MAAFFMTMGVMTCIAVAGFAVLMTAISIKEGIQQRKRMNAIKHRFDKPPTAKCYCVDCKSYSKHNGDCFVHAGWKVADNWFCWSAIPSTESMLAGGGGSGKGAE